jgi:hypothetical protein
MFTKEKAFKVAVITLGVLALTDIFRGFMHTFNIWYASENIAHMTQTADTLMLMITFGISNFLTAFIYILIILKAKHLVPYVLLIIPISYIIGIISLFTTGIAEMQSSAWNGQNMLSVYLPVSFIIGINYFIASYREKRQVN